MKTNDLIDMLASGPDVAVANLPNAGLRRATILGAGVLGSVAMMAMLLGVRPDLRQVLQLPAFWVKIAFVISLSLAGYHASWRLALPGANWRTLPFVIAAPLLLMWLLGAANLVNAAPDERAQLFWGDTWRYCAFLIAILSLPIFAAALHVMRQMAPTRLRQAGAAAGFAAGSAAATVYCLHCPEMAPSFIGFWYVLGILVPTLLGAAIGPRILAW